MPLTVSRPGSFALAVTATVSAYAAYRVVKFVFWEPYFSPWRKFSGPPNPSFFLGNFKHIGTSDVAFAQDKYVKKYGDTVVFWGPLNTSFLYTLDLKAITYILNSESYEKPLRVRSFLERFVGNGLLLAEGLEHRRQRRVMNPAFGPSQIRDLTGIFISKANELRNIWCHEVNKSAHESATIDVLPWLSRTALDVIGLAGFNYRFNSLSSTPNSPNELSEALESVFQREEKFSVWDTLVTLFPVLRKIPSKRGRQLQHGLSVMNRISSELLSEKKASILASATNSSVEKRSLQDRDLMSLLLRANMASDVPQSQRLSDETVMAQIPTFIVAGHETTAAVLAWTLHSLSLSQDLQSRLRHELQSLQLPGSIEGVDALDAETYAKLDSMPLLDAVVRESLRLWAPVTYTMRVPNKDDFIPLDHPICDRSGKLHESFPMKKGDMVIVPILGLHHHEAFWGKDSHEFKPERWLAGTPSSAKGIPGVWANIMTFYGGTHSCIGHRFAVIEIKTILHSLLTTIVFKPSAPDIIRKHGVAARPHVASQPKKGSQLPLIVELA